MPAPQASVMQALAKMRFRSFAIHLPTDWREPSGDPAGWQYRAAFQPAELAALPPPFPPALFMSASANKYHCDTARHVSDGFTAYIDGVCSAVCAAWSQWQSIATMTGVVINAVTAAAGQVAGPLLMPLIMASAPKSTPMELKYSNAIALAVSTGWLSYTATIKVPALPWYPAFAAVPSAVAPPTPNIPSPVAALAQVTVPVSKAVLKAQMIGNFAYPTALHHSEFFDSIADAFEKCFQIWQTSTMVTNVMGTGPVPSFAPPFVPVGPVVGGVGNMPPGGFA